jgi:hypothetical protein
MTILEGTLYVQKIASKWVLKGFTQKDIRTLGMLARNRYKLKTKRKRILKKYIIKLMNEALKNHAWNLKKVNT